MENKPFDKTYWEGEIPVQNLYTAGVAGEKFLRALKEKGEFLAATCQTCKKTWFPPHAYCHLCFEELTDWHPIPKKGKVYSFTAVRDKLFALIEFPDVEGKLLHQLGGVNADDVKIGLPVEPVFKEPPARTGSILDILHFKPRR